MALAALYSLPLQSATFCSVAPVGPGVASCLVLCLVRQTSERSSFKGSLFLHVPGKRMHGNIVSGSRLVLQNQSHASVTQEVDRSTTLILSPVKALCFSPKSHDLKAVLDQARVCARGACLCVHEGTSWTVTCVFGHLKTAATPHDPRASLPWRRWHPRERIHQGRTRSRTFGRHCYLRTWFWLFGQQR